MRTEIRSFMLPVVLACAVSAGMDALAEGPIVDLALAGEWNQWRGPNRNGVSVGGPPLAEVWPEKGLVRLWKSEIFPAHGEGGIGLGSVAACGGRAYVFLNIPSNAPISSRTLDVKAVQSAGWFDRKRMPPELLGKAEAAIKDKPLSPESSAAERKAWAGEWVKLNVDTNDLKAWGNFIQTRLEQGGPALDLLDKLQAAIDNPEKKRVFESLQAFEAWLDEQKIAGPVRESIVKAVPTTSQVADDVVLCLNARTGETVWKAKFEGVPGAYYAGSTPCVSGGRLYVAGTTHAYCLNAATGQPVWLRKWSKAGATPSSFAVADGLAFVVGVGGLQALDAETGEPAWSRAEIGGYSSPIVWRYEGQTRILCANGAWGKNLTVCLDAKTGKTLWEVQGASPSTPAVEGDVLVLNLAADLLAYRISPTGGEKLWAIPHMKPRYGTHTGNDSPLIYEGHVYLVGSGAVTCCDLKTGEIAWRQTNVVYDTCCSSGVIADGKLFGFAGTQRQDVFMAAASPEFKAMGRSPNLSPEICTSPAIAGGRLFLRHAACIAAYDLAREPATGKGPAVK